MATSRKVYKKNNDKNWKRQKKLQLIQFGPLHLILRDTAMDDKLIHILNDYQQNYP